MLKVFVVVVTYNGLKWIDKCFGSLIESQYPINTIAVDNGSKDGTLEILNREYPEVDLVDQGQNLGFGKANNIGIKRALDQNADYIFLLNQDAWIEIDTIEVLVRSAEKHPEYGVLSPMHLNGKGDGLDFNFSKYLCPPSTQNLYSDLFFKRNKSVYGSQYVNAAAWFLTRECLESVGGFNEAFYHYGEDNEFLWQVFKHGYKLGVCTDSSIYHDRLLGTGNKKVHRDQNVFNRALLEIIQSNQGLPNTVFLVRKLIGYFLLSMIGYGGRNEEVRLEIRKNAIMIRLVNDRKFIKRLFSREIRGF